MSTTDIALRLAGAYAERDIVVDLAARLIMASVRAEARITGIPTNGCSADDVRAIAARHVQDERQETLNGGNRISSPSVRVAIDLERMHHLLSGYTPEHDDKAGVGHLMGEIKRQVEGAEPELSANDVRAVAVRLVRIAAVAVAALESVDRTERRPE